MIENIIIMVSGVYLILLGMIFSTKNIRSLIIFKAIPFFLGLASILVAVKELGWLG